jgi:hypothetical protein
MAQATNPNFYNKGSFGSKTGLTGATTQTVPMTTTPVLPTFDMPAPLPLVSRITVYDPSFLNTATTTFYNYGGLTAQFRRGLQGFRYVRSKNMPSGNWEETAYRLDWPYTGMPDTVSRGNANLSDWPTGVQSATSLNNWISQTQYLYTATDLLNSGNNTTDTAPTSNCTLVNTHPTQQSTTAVYLVYPFRAIEKTRSLNNLNTLLSTVTTDTVTETVQGNTTCLDVQTVDNLKNLSWDKKTVNTFDSPTAIWTTSGNWLPGRLLSSTVTSKSPTPYAYQFTAALGANQGGYTPLAYNPNSNDGTLGPVYPNIMPWFIPVMSLILN